MKRSIILLVITLFSFFTINSCSNIICSEEKELPSIVITSHTDGQTVSGIVEIHYNPSKNLNILQTELWVNGQYWILGNKTQPFVFNWYTKDLRDGSYEIEINILDSDSMKYSSDPITLIVDNSMYRPNPVNVISVIYNKTGMTVIWNKSDAVDFSHYSILHIVSSEYGTQGQIIPDIYNINDTTLTINDFNPTVENWFRVAVADTQGYYAYGERLVNEIEQPPIIPVLNNVTNDENSILISWNENNEDDFLYYVLYESTSSQMKHKTILYSSTNSGDTTFTFNIGADKFIFYQVEVVDYWDLSSKSDIKFTSSYPKIAFVSSRDGNSDIIKMDSDGTNVINLTQSEENEKYPQIFPNDSKILYMINTWGANGLRDEIFMMNEDGTNQTQLTQNSSYPRALPVISPDGSKIAYADNKGLYIIDVNSLSINSLLSDNNLATLDFSIDGENLVYTKFVTNYRYSIRTVNISGSNPKNIKSVPGTYKSHIYFVNNDKIIYQYSRDDSSRIYIMDSDGTNAINLTNEYPQNQLINISNDKTKLIVKSGTGNHLEVKIINLDSTVINNLHLNIRAIPYLAPNNNKIVYSNSGNICIIDVDGNNLLQLTENTTNDGAPIFFHH